jgi:RNA ligase (TIGR02306 family)
MTKFLAVVGRIIETSDIPGADLIIQASVVCGASGKWSGVVSKDTKVGDIVTVFLQDAVLPPSDRWGFMERHKWRVRMARFKGVPSECIIISGAPDMPPGTDLTDALGVTKYEKPIPSDMVGDAVGAFPAFLPKTEEPNFQTVDFATLMEQPFYVTEKADGSSCTAWCDGDGLHVASRNWELKELTTTGASNIYWSAARKYKLDELPSGMAVQFEVVGPGVQKNPMGLTAIEGRLFGAFKCDESGAWHRLSVGDFPNLMPLAREIQAKQKPYTADELRELAAIKYQNGKHGEGVVIRAVDQGWSFKVINLNYKD